MQNRVLRSTSKSEKEIFFANISAVAVLTIRTIIW